MKRDMLKAGSTNMDNRSFRLNDECNLNAIDPKWALQMVEVFRKDKSHANEVTWEMWNNRPLWDKFIEHGPRFFRSQV